MNNSQKNKSPASGSHSSPFPQPTSFASELLHVFVYHVREKEEVEEEEEKKINQHNHLENISIEIFP